MIPRPTEEEAQRMYDWICSLNVTWKERADAMRDERQVDPLLAIGILAGNTLESGEHMAAPILEELMDGFSPAGSKLTCSECGNEYTALYGGQPYCGNACADAARGIVRTPSREIIEVSNRPMADLEPDDEAILKAHQIGTIFQPKRSRNNR